MSEPSILICYRVADLDPQALSTVAMCDACGSAVWIADSSPKADERICLQCLRARIGNEPFSIEPPTKEQVAELKKVLEK